MFARLWSHFVERRQAKIPPSLIRGRPIIDWTRLNTIHAAAPLGAIELW
jgi:hypothetical protein